MNMEAAMEILERQFVAPVGTDWPTQLIFDEIANIWKMMEGGEIDIVVTIDNFKYYWRRAKERTALLYSKLHFGHYKLAAHSDLLSEMYALKVSLIYKTGMAHERWARGLSVMLEKISGVALVTKLLAILLTERDFNFHNTLIFGKRMMNLARRHDIVLEEI